MAVRRYVKNFIHDISPCRDLKGRKDLMESPVCQEIQEGPDPQARPPTLGWVYFSLTNVPVS